MINYPDISSTVHVTLDYRIVKRLNTEGKLTMVFIRLFIDLLPPSIYFFPHHTGKPDKFGQINFRL